MNLLCQERIEVSSELKKTKYAALQREGKAKGWGVTVWAVEVGCRGFPASSMASLLKDLWIGGGKTELPTATHLA